MKRLKEAVLRKTYAWNSAEENKRRYESMKMKQ